MLKLKQALGLKVQSRSKYEGMRDAKTKLPTGGGKHIMDISFDEGDNRSVTTFLTGTYKAGKEDGLYGMQLSEFLRFEGEMVNGEVSGIGMLTNTNLDCSGTYTGEWKAGVRHGFGKAVDKVTNSIYIGEFKDGWKHGHGTMEDKDG